MNQIKIISKQQMEQIANNYDESCHLVFIDGEKNKNWEDYIKTIEEKYKFPTKNDYYDGYSDWMRDLSWFAKDKFILCINNYDSFLSEDLESKKIVMKMFENTILPWWDGDVEKYVLGGEKKEFNVFLVY